MENQISRLYEYYNQQKKLFQELQTKQQIFAHRERIINTKPPKAKVLEFVPPTDNKTLQTKKRIKHSIKWNKEEIKNFLENHPREQQEVINSLLIEASELNNILRELAAPEEKDLFIKEIKGILETIEWIKNLKFSKKETKINKNQPSTIPNKIVFLRRNNERIEFYENILKDIPRELYNDFKVLLDSIINGTFKGSKAFFEKMYWEVSFRQARILYYQINQTTYLILTGFQKDFMQNIQYRQRLAYFDDLLKKQLNAYKLLATNPYFLETEEQVTQDIYKLLNREKEEKDESRLSRNIRESIKGNESN